MRCRTAREQRRRVYNPPPRILGRDRLFTCVCCDPPRKFSDLEALVAHTEARA
jgi:hypothetical protein